MIEENTTAVESYPRSIEELQRRTWPRLLANIVWWLDSFRSDSPDGPTLVDTLARNSAQASFHEFVDEWNRGCEKLGLDPVEASRGLAGDVAVWRVRDEMPQADLPYVDTSRMLDELADRELAAMS